METDTSKITMENKEFIPANKLNVYLLARNLSSIAWEVYEHLDWQDKKNMGDQFISSIDSIGANIIEGYGRYHYLDKIRFYYISRASFNESIYHWLDLLYERGKIDQDRFTKMNMIAKDLEIKLNNFIGTTYNQYKKSKDEKR